MATYLQIDTLRIAVLAVAFFTIADPTHGQNATTQVQITQHEQKLEEAREGKNRKDEATELNSLGQLYSQAGQKQKALDFFDKALFLRREMGNHSGEAITLFNEASVYRDLGQPQKALDSYTHALHIASDLGDRASQAAILSAMGLIYHDINQPQKALECFDQALPMRREVGNRRGEAITLNSIGLVYSETGDQQKALEAYRAALPIEHELGDQAGEASVLNNIGLVFSEIGQPQEALRFFDQALPVSRGLDDGRSVATTLNNMGTAYSHIGEPQKALEVDEQALGVEREIGNRRMEAVTLTTIGLVYWSIGQEKKALEMYNQALPIQREVGNRSAEATTLISMGVVYLEVNQPQKALELFGQGLRICREIGNRSAEGYALNNIGRAYQSLGQSVRALKSYKNSIEVLRETGDRNGEARAIWNLGYVSNDINDPSNALRYTAAALSLAEALGDPDLQGGIDDSLMRHFQRVGRSELAIHFGLAAISAYQQIRRNMSGLGKDLQAGFAKSKSSTYRTLAELLVSQNRLTEAEHVLDLLKDAELKETVRGAANDPAATTSPLPLTDADRAAEAAIAAEATEAASLTDASFEFDRLNALPSPTESDKAKLKDLSARIAAGNAAIDTFFNKTLYEQLGGDTKSNARASAADTETSSLSNLLAQLGPGTLALYTLVGDQHSYLIVTTANTRTRYEIKTSAADLGKLILALRQELKSPAADPSKDLDTLSHLLLDPIAADLATAGKQAPDHIPTLLWSLDGVLRYVPMSALFDPAQPAGRQYLVERARNVIITPESRNHLLDAPSANLSAIGFGLSKSYESFPALSGVSAELNAVVHDPTVAASHGPLTGKLMRDDAFTLTALEANLRARPAVVHIASHFVFQSGKSGESYLLLGGEDTGGAGYELTMSRLQTDPQLSFRGTRLLTLSACSTAEADTTSNGREIDSLGMVVQKRDAAAVLATLWDVNDASTSLLMSDFYRRWATTPNIEKIEALRQAQIALLEGPPSRQQPTTARGPQIEAPASSAIQTKYSHPYFWAPFVLIGNYR